MTRSETQSHTRQRAYCVLLILIRNCLTFWKMTYSVITIRIYKSSVIQNCFFIHTGLLFMSYYLSCGFCQIKPGWGFFTELVLRYCREPYWQDIQVPRMWILLGKYKQHEWDYCPYRNSYPRVIQTPDFLTRWYLILMFSYNILSLNIDTAYLCISFNVMREHTKWTSSKETKFNVLALALLNYFDWWGSLRSGTKTAKLYQLVEGINRPLVFCWFYRK